MNRLGLVSIIGATLVLAACGSAATASSSSPSAPQTGGAFRGGSTGQLVQINGQTLILSGANGDITVSYTSATTISKTSTAALADITPGVCIVATGAKDTTGLVTATTVRLAVKGASGCTAGGFGAAPAAGASPRPNPGGQANLSNVSGEVTAVSGTSVTVLTLTSASQTITVPTTAAVTQSSSTSAAALQVGECVRASGSPDASGTVQATALTITPAGPSGTCSAGFGGFGRGPASNGAPAAGG
jgi:Domain of unknown function (DUF5666)